METHPNVTDIIEQLPEISDLSVFMKETKLFIKAHEKAICYPHTCVTKQNVCFDRDNDENCLYGENYSSDL